ncbi:MAG: hypothetical protein H6738_03695 [Alphaproteobacteria bacterium]|nr:hypothetical protein [Alphaproteobacteria bacterium]MCB9695872.1 hypothetical protein [Alphaproteobacteria bacterium]
MIAWWTGLALAAPLPFAEACATNWLVPDTEAHTVRDGQTTLHRFRERVLLQAPEVTTSQLAREHACFLWKDLRARTHLARYVLAEAAPDAYYHDLYTDMVAVCVPECRRIATQLDLAKAATAADEAWCQSLCDPGRMTSDPVCDAASIELRPATVEACELESK